MHQFLRYLIVAAIVLAASCVSAKGQFRKDAFSQNYADAADTLGRDTTDVLFSFKEYFGGLRHEKDVRIGVLAGGSAVFVGGMQMYNRDYWKLPVIYGGIGAGVGGGLAYRMKYNRDGNDDFRQMSNWFFAGAGLVYWASLMDGTVNYKKDVKGQAGKATLYSLLLPGLGQAYNGEYWKIPIYYGVMAGSVHFYLENRQNFKRYQGIYRQITDGSTPYDGPITEQTAQYYRNLFRRYRDYSVLAIAASYLLQVIDANVFSYMRDFDLSDDIALDVSPAVITTDRAYAFNPSSNGFGLRLGITF